MVWAWRSWGEGGTEETEELKCLGVFTWRYAWQRHNVGGKVTYSSSDEVGTSLLSFGVMIDVERKQRGESILSAII